MMIGSFIDDPAMMLLAMLGLIAAAMAGGLVWQEWKRRRLRPAGKPAPAAPISTPPAGADEPRIPMQAAETRPDDALPGLAERKRVMAEAARTTAEGADLMRRLDRWEHGSANLDADARRALDEHKTGNGGRDGQN
jgi:hypothetical protein